MRGFFVYFRAQLKRCLCFWPKILVLTLISAICIASFAYNTLQSKAEEEEASALKLKIGVCGDLRDTYLDLAVFALQNFDSSQYYAEMVTMSEEEAAEKLSRGEISGYVIVPEGYVEAVVAGEELQVTYVMNESPATIVPMLMKEVIETISDYVVESETSIYSYTKICRERGIPRSEYRIDADNMSLACLERILSRTSVVKTEVAEGDGVSFESYYICAFFILLLLLWGMTWSPLFVKKDGLLLKMLYFRGMSAPAQLAGELLAYFAASVFNLVIAAG
ncbi:MAG: ABC transporter permease, partial [Clostridia bacterium]|nr:ABC transporter permease [Clostridia bacterium]